VFVWFSRRERSIIRSEFIVCLFFEMNSSEELSTFFNVTLPQALEGLNQSHRNIDQIAQYCKNAYSSEDQAAVFGKTQNYVKDALSNVAYHVHSVSINISNFLQMQADEIGKIGIQIHDLAMRSKVIHDGVGIYGLQTQDSIRTYRKQPKQRKLEESELPENARPTGRFTRQAINLKALDNVGIDLSGHRGTDQFSFNAPPPLMSGISASAYIPTIVHSGSNATPGATFTRSTSIPSMVSSMDHDASDLPPPPPPPLDATVSSMSYNGGSSSSSGSFLARPPLTLNKDPSNQTTTMELPPPPPPPDFSDLPPPPPPPM